MPTYAPCVAQVTLPTALRAGTRYEVALDPRGALRERDGLQEDFADLALRGAYWSPPAQSSRRI